MTKIQLSPEVPNYFMEMDWHEGGSREAFSARLMTHYEAGDVILERQCLLEHAAQLVDLGAQLLGALRVLSDLSLGATLSLGDVLGLFVEGRQHGDEPLE